MTNIALGFASAIFPTQLSPQPVYFIQTGGNGLSDTNMHSNTAFIATDSYTAYAYIATVDIASYSQLMH